MIFEGKIPIRAQAPTVWDLLLDVNRMAACMPGVEEVTLIDDRTFDGVIAAAVGPISGKFSFRARIVECTPPTAMVARLEGTDSVTNSALSGEMAMALDPAGADGTELAYRASVDVQGRLAILGDMVLRTTALLIVEEFTKRLRAELERPGV